MTQLKCVYLLILIAVLIVTPVLAQTTRPTANAQTAGSAPVAAESATGPAANESAKKLDVSDLETRYWSAKDTDYTVVQNRLFSKAKRLALSLGYGIYVNDPWSTGPTYNAALSYYFSERYGIEADYSLTNSVDSAATSNLKQQQSGAPNHGKMKSFYGGAFNWVPLYGKVSVLNSSIIYFDFAVSPGLGVVGYEQQTDSGGISQSAAAFTLDVTQHFFLNRTWALRFDYKNRWYNEQVVQYHAPTTGRTTQTQINNTSLLMLGVTVFY
jgi:outer membrane beta-barrel protein